MVEEFVRGVCLLTRVCVVSVCQRSRKPNTERKLALGFVEALPIFAVTQRSCKLNTERKLALGFVEALPIFAVTQRTLLC